MYLVRRRLLIEAFCVSNQFFHVTFWKFQLIRLYPEQGSFLQKLLHIKLISGQINIDNLVEDSFAGIFELIQVEVGANV